MSEIYYQLSYSRLQIALFIIGAAGTVFCQQRDMSANTLHEGFGRKISWEDDGILPPGHQMTFKQALHITSSSFMLKLVVPDWVPAYSKQIRDTRLAFDELQVLMLHDIHSRVEYSILLF